MKLWHLPDHPFLSPVRIVADSWSIASQIARMITAEKAPKPTCDVVRVTAYPPAVLHITAAFGEGLDQGTVSVRADVSNVREATPALANLEAAKCVRWLEALQRVSVSLDAAAWMAGLSVQRVSP